MIEKGIEQLHHNVDRYNVIVDLKNFGFQNLEISSVMATGFDLNRVYLNRINKIYVVNTNWLIGTFMTIARLFINPVTLEKIIFLDDLEDE